MKKLYAIILIVFINSLLLFSEQKTIVRYFSDIDLHPYKFTINYYNEIQAKDTIGEWESTISYKQQSNIKINYEYFPDKLKTKYVKVDYNKFMQPVSIKKFINGSLFLNFDIDYNNNNHIQKISLKSNETTTILIYSYNDKNSILKIDFLNKRNNILYFKNFSYTNSELKIITYFPDNYLKTIDIFKILNSQDFEWKQQIFQKTEHIIIFNNNNQTSDNNTIASDSKKSFIDDRNYKMLTQLNYNNFINYNSYKYFSAYPSESYTIFGSNNTTPPFRILKTANAILEKEIYYDITNNYDKILYNTKIEDYYVIKSYSNQNLIRQSTIFKNENIQNEIYSYYHSGNLKFFKKYINKKAVLNKSYAE